MWIECQVLDLCGDEALGEGCFGVGADIAEDFGEFEVGGCVWERLDVGELGPAAGGGWDRLIGGSGGSGGSGGRGGRGGSVARGGCVMCNEEESFEVPDGRAKEWVKGVVLDAMTSRESGARLRKSRLGYIDILYISFKICLLA